MKEWKGYTQGVNLGGWYSQCDYSKERLDHFIEEADFQIMKAWGFDHVRLPVDYNILVKPDGTWVEDGFVRIEKVIHWCERYHLNMVLDLHKTPGYSFDEGEQEAGFFTSSGYQEMFYSLWEELAKRFGKYCDRVAFELLNEVTEQAYLDAWVRIYREAIRRIRSICPKATILIGSYWYNSVRTVKDLKGPFDENTVLSFHCYDPQLFTHQRAYWQKTMPSDFVMEYPVTYDILKEKNQEIYHDGEMFAPFANEDTIGTEFFEKLFAEAIKTAEAFEVPLYCGEYGVIDRADIASTLKWYKDIHAVLTRHKIGHALWSYREMDFGFTDARMDDIRDEIIESGKIE
ncbi:Aryl-phospho-beta-D-glucosidase BglC, GH1 family [Lachnospiraceae bacterium XBB1006]|nr:Aryl-phospho-beta-D-glucosidase BglC, GH1 family [Lachnospiraceae bacterium XBB1006]